MISLKGSLSLCFSSSTMSGGGLIPLSSNSDATVAVRIDPDSSEELSMTRATIDSRFSLISGTLCQLQVWRWLSDLDLRYK